MATNGNANAVPFIRNSNLFRKRIMDSLVCWYDPGKQQCTNESMAANPVLADLSGNGHDITCYNFAWAGMSGIGGYVYDNSNLLVSITYGTISGNIISIISNEGAKIGTQIAARKPIIGKKGETLTYIRKAFDVKISNLPDEINIQVNLGKNNGNKTEWEMIGYFYNGINHVDEKVFTIEPYDSESIPSINDFRILFSKELASVENIADVDITIEILPEYPNALVSDGVDDYAYVEGLPILTKEKGYTVIAKRKLFYKENASQALASTGAFILEKQEVNSSKFTYNFGSANAVNTYPEEITYQTSKSFNGTSLNVGDGAGTDRLTIFAHTTDYTSIALYSFLLFDRTLTTAEIEWVKKNIIESKLLLKTNWADSSLWAFYNLDYQGRIDGTISSNRMLITANGRRTDILPTSNFMEVRVENTQTPAYNIKVTGLKNGIVLTYRDRGRKIHISEDGIYSIPEHNTQDRYFGYSFNKAFENENIVIQQLLS